VADVHVDCIANEYSGFTPVEGEHLNGQLMLGENGTDSAGIRLAFMALVSALVGGSVQKGKMDGFTPQQEIVHGLCPNLAPERTARSGQDV